MVDSHFNLITKVCILKHFNTNSEFLLITEPRTKRRTVAKLLTIEDDPNLLLHAAQRSSSRRGEVDLSHALKEVIQHQNDPKSLLMKMKQTVPLKLSCDEALAFLLVNDFSKKNYTSIRALCIKQDSAIFPCYDVVKHAKAHCRPQGISSTASKVSVPLQSLIEHTIRRIITCNEASFEGCFEDDDVALKLSFLFSAGCDGTTGCGQYEQELSKNIKDNSLIATVINPLRITCNDKAVWENPTPHSSRMIRPLELWFEKETKATIKEIKKAFDLQKNNLEEVVVQLPSGKWLFISATAFFSMIDGKVLNHITETSAYSVCPHCKATPLTFNDITNFTQGKFKAEESTYEYGLSDLHVKIRIFEAVLHLSYNSVLPEGQWQVRGDVNKANVAERKKIIQERFKDELNLIVDMPRGKGAGTSNTGNTSRRAFENIEKLSEVLEIDLKLLSQLKIIMDAVSCELPIDPAKFENHAKETFENYVQLYPSRPMTVTLHRLLLHGAQIIAYHILPIGFLSEEGAESKNKVYKRDRQFHARKSSRENNVTDMFNRAMDTSDPVIANIAIKTSYTRVKHLKMSEELKAMLVADETNNSELGELVFGEFDEEVEEDRRNNYSLMNSDIYDEI